MKRCTFKEKCEWKPGSESQCNPVKLKTSGCPYWQEPPAQEPEMPLDYTKIHNSAVEAYNLIECWIPESQQEQALHALERTMQTISSAQRDADMLVLRAALAAEREANRKETERVEAIHEQAKHMELRAQKEELLAKVKAAVEGMPDVAKGIRENFGVEISPFTKDQFRRIKEHLLKVVSELSTTVS